MSKTRIALFPDSLTHYRVPVFNNLARIPDVDLHVYAADKKGSGFKAMKLGDKGDCAFRLIENKCYFIKGYQAYQTKVVKTVLSGEYDVVVVWGVCWYFSNWLAGILKSITRSKTKLVFWTPGFYGDEGLILRNVRKVFYRFADSFLLYGNRGKAYLAEYGFASHKLHVIYNSLNTQLQGKLYDELKETGGQGELVKRLPELNTDCKTGIYVGRLQRRKQLEQVFEAIPLLKEKYGVDFRFLIVGDGPDRDFLETEIKNKGLTESVVFCGGIYEEETLCKMFLGADVCVTPGHIGLLAMHSLAYGTPVVTHGSLEKHAPEIEVIDDGVNGSLFERGDIADLADSIHSAIKLKESVSGNDIRASVLKHYNLENQAKVFREMLASIGF